MARISRRAFCARVIAYLRTASEEPENRNYWDDYCISWMTVAKAYHGEAQPHFWATYEHLGTAPAQIWPMIMAKRKNTLGRDFALWFDQAGNVKPDLPKKPAQSEKFAAMEIARRVGAEEVSKNQKRRELLDSRRLESVKGTGSMGALTASRYRNSEQSASANIAASLCLSCHCPVSPRRHLCRECLRRGHSSGCPSPNSQCTCGFSEFFWRDMESPGSGDGL